MLVIGCQFTMPRMWNSKCQIVGHQYFIQHQMIKIYVVTSSENNYANRNQYDLNDFNCLLFDHYYLTIKSLYIWTKSYQLYSYKVSIFELIINDTSGRLISLNINSKLTYFETSRNIYLSEFVLLFKDQQQYAQTITEKCKWFKSRRTFNMTFEMQILMFAFS